MNRKLTEEQVTKLFAFCRKSEIYAYDLQIEIVDHLASSIEEQWQKNPELSFGWALKNALEKFGKTGLKMLEYRLRRQLKQNFNRILFNYLLEYFRWPKLVITVAVFLSIFTLLQFTNNNFRILLFISIPLSLFSIYYHFFIFPKKLDINIAKNKTFELIDYLKNINAKIGGIIQLPFWFLVSSNDAGMRSSNTLKIEILIAFLFSLLLVFLYGHFYFLPQKIREYFYKNYSEFAK
jgi:hypothetical protein